MPPCLSQHAPRRHCGRVGSQALPQAPQLFASVERSTHEPPHDVPEMHVQTPFVQVWFAAQACPQLPQFAAVVMSVSQPSASGAVVRQLARPDLQPV